MNEIEELHEIEEETKLEIIRLEEECDDEQKKNMIHHVGKLLETYFKEVKVLIAKQKDNENLSAFVSKVKEETKSIVDKTKDKLEEVKEEEKIQEFISTISHKVDAMAASLSENETLHKMKKSVMHTYDNVKNDPHLKEGVGKLRNVTLKAAQKALSKVEEKLSQNDDEVTIHEVKED